MLNPEGTPKAETLVTTKEILPTRFSPRRQFHIKPPHKVEGGWLHIYDEGKEKAYLAAIALQERLEKEEDEARKASWRAYCEEEHERMAEEDINSKTPELVLSSLLGQKLVRYCRSSGHSLKLEFENLTVTLSFTSRDDEADALTINTNS